MGALHENLQSGESHRAVISNDFKVPTSDSNTADTNCELGLENDYAEDGEPQAADRLDPDSFSTHQKQKVRSQCMTIWYFLSVLVPVLEEELRIIMDVLEGIDDLSFIDKETLLKGLSIKLDNHRHNNTHYDVIAARTLELLKTVPFCDWTRSISIPVIRRWWKKYACSNYKGFPNAEKSHQRKRIF